VAVASRRVTVAAGGTLLSSVPSDNNAGQSVLAVNKGATAVERGPLGGTPTTMFEVVAGDGVTVDLQAGEALYGYGANVRVDVLETGL
jgi:hypothetical protein